MFPMATLIAIPKPTRRKEATMTGKGARAIRGVHAMMRRVWPRARSLARPRSARRESRKKAEVMKPIAWPTKMRETMAKPML
jgi:hypothetical protein